MTAPTLLLRDRRIGPGNDCFVVAEAGVNHNGDLRVAHALIDAAATTGADAVKFQIFDPRLLASELAHTAPYQTNRTGLLSQGKMLEGLRLPDAGWAELASHAGERGIVFFATPFDMPSAKLLVDLGAPLIKVPSGELDNTSFIMEMAGLGLPLLISTGMGTLDEVGRAVDAAAAAPALAVLHCVTAYPAPSAVANLGCIPAMAARFGTPVGWSDHTRGFTTALVAVALGASIIEKHLTLDRTSAGPDHAASMETEHFTEYVSLIREAQMTLGDGVKRPVPIEEQNRVHARRSVHAVRDLRAGEALTSGDVVLLRPATGLPPSTVLTGLRLVRAVPAGAPITPDDVV